MKDDIVAAVNLCRKKIIAEGITADIEQIHRCIVPILSKYRDNIHINTLLRNCANRSFSCGNLLDLTCFSDPEFIVGFFSVPYNPDAFLEAMRVKIIPLPKVVTDLVPISDAVPAVIESCTEGFLNPLAVAVFAENYRDAEVKEHHQAYYLIDKFVARFKGYTRKAIDAFWSPTAFADIIDADDPLLINASAIWVHLHEHYHRRGYLPLPEHLKAKSSRNGAGAEELRVDILTLLTLLRLSSPVAELRAATQYILAERLIRYPLQASAQDNYDARSSVALFQYLQRHGIIASNGGKFYFRGGYAALEQALQSIAVKMAALEYRLSRLPQEERKQRWSLLLPALANNNNQWSLQA
ncbi:hypothetical protein SerAS12_4294 [Serratia sp. AS12]|uniref:DUF6421 family protein n=1 Tax=Serratia TaxID=613 RepID=UPI00020E9BA7|nr:MULTISPECIES: DUF6421 family protein [Serratia]AEF47387.1 hypothetical protein SerAS9_4293 [Serratia plymuthica AS9]AEF52339.1 hypothetical protein SerAS12_4294 [Serratia sp. AS12]AEG30046.1 hypothetical protein SerAS13_4294 [Serratia sp. AS13]MBJ7894032.1 hypothetical protein [Serratia sp. PAMC26656]UTN96056.1 DUF6421 family protein [Serratia plymuthica]